MQQLPLTACWICEDWALSPWFLRPRMAEVGAEVDSVWASFSAHSVMAAKYSDRSSFTIWANWAPRLGASRAMRSGPTAHGSRAAAREQERTAYAALSAVPALSTMQTAARMC